MPGAKLCNLLDVPVGIWTRNQTPATCMGNTTTALGTGPLDQNFANLMDNVALAAINNN